MTLLSSATPSRPELRLLPSDAPLLPCDVEAERATLGALLIDRDAIIAVAPWLAETAFYLEKHAWVYEAVLACYAARTPPDLRTVSDALRRLDRLAAIGGVSYLVELGTATPTAVHVEYYARIVERTALLRRLIVAGGAISALGYDEALGDGERLTRIEQTLTAALARPGLHALTSAADAVDALFATLDDSGPHGVATGLADLDAKTDGLQRGDLILLAGRPGMGKTSLALQVLQNVSAQGGTVLLCSLEMGTTQLMQRLAASRSGIDLMALRRRQLTPPQVEALTRQLGALSALPFYLDDTSGLSLAELRAKALTLKASLAASGRSLDLLVVDYLQLMAVPDGGRKGGTRTEDVGAISRGLKQLARELDAPVLALSQLSRAVEARNSHVPMLSDLRDSGSLEQDADLVVFVYREEVYDAATANAGVAELHLAKHRNGPTGVVPVRYDAPTQRWSNLARHQ